MAGSGLFQRLGNLWRGFLSLWISDIEKEHPEIAYENAINSMVEKYSRLKSATAAIIRRREDIDERLKKSAKDLAQTELELNTAVETNQDDLAVVLIQRKNALSAELAEMQGDLGTASRDADGAKQSLLNVQGEIRKLKAERDVMLARMQSAQARLRIQEQLDGLSVDADVKALDNVREHIKNTIAEANLGKELGENDLDTKLKALRQQTGEATSKSEWERLRNANAAKAGQKTM
jgi:phage shock protein A